MSTKEIQDMVMKITEETFKVVKKVYDSQKEGKPDKSSENKKPSNPPENAGSSNSSESEKHGNSSESEGHSNPSENPGSTNPSDGKGVSSRIIFPKNARGVDRISEQEVRFIFVEQLNKYADEYGIYYSVETPTENRYKFPENGEPEVDPEGRSANTDLTIHDSEFNRICLIEFKALNPDKHDYKKDYCKLFNEPNPKPKTCLRFFIQMIKNYDSGTLPNIQDKLDAYKKEPDNVAEIHYIGYCLEKGTLLEIENGKLIPKPLED